MWLNRHDIPGQTSLNKTRKKSQANKMLKLQGLIFLVLEVITGIGSVSSDSQDGDTLIPEIWSSVLRKESVSRHSITAINHFDKESEKVKDCKLVSHRITWRVTGSLIIIVSQENNACFFRGDVKEWGRHLFLFFFSLRFVCLIDDFFHHSCKSVFGNK